MSKTKLLIFRPSHFGDIIFGFKNLHNLHDHFQGQIEIDWVVDNSYIEFMKTQTLVNQVYGMKMLTHASLRDRPNIDYNYYDYIYDSQNDPWSRQELKSFKGHLIRKSRYRWNRFWLLNTNIKFMQRPMPGVWSHQKPLIKAFGLNPNMDYIPHLDFSKINIPSSLDSKLPKHFIGIITGASMPLKRWPDTHWKTLITNLINTYNTSVVAIGGPEDRLNDFRHPQFTDLSGELSWAESAYVLSKSNAFIGGDTGLTHLADYLKIPSVHIRGGSTFGFPSNPNTALIYKNLKCQPCTKNGRGECHNTAYPLQCLYEIKPQEVLRALSSVY